MEAKEQENEQKRRELLALALGVFSFVMLLVGGTYAYFTIVSTNSSSTTAVSADASSSSGSVALSGTSAQLYLNLTTHDMLKTGSDITYYASATGNPSYSANYVEIGHTEVVGSGTYNCNYAIRVTVSGTNSTYLAFQGMASKSNGQIVLVVGTQTSITNNDPTIKYDFNTTNLFPLTITGTLNGLSENHSEVLKAAYYIVNMNNVNQLALQNTDLHIAINATSFTCSQIDPNINNPS